MEKLPEQRLLLHGASDLQHPLLLQLLVDEDVGVILRLVRATGVVDDAHDRRLVVQCVDAQDLSKSRVQN